MNTNVIHFYHNFLISGNLTDHLVFHNTPAPDKRTSFLEPDTAGCSNLLSLQLDFSHVLAEPHSTHGFDPFWRLSALTFRGTHRWLYRLLAAVVALPLSIAWGVVFAVLSLLSVWLLTPLQKVLHLVFSFVTKVGPSEEQ